MAAPFDLASLARQRRTLAALPPGGLAALYLAALAWHRRTHGEAATLDLVARSAAAARRGRAFPLSPAQAATVAALRACQRGPSLAAYRAWLPLARDLYEAARRGQLAPGEPPWPEPKKAS